MGTSACSGLARRVAGGVSVPGATRRLAPSSTRAPQPTARNEQGRAGWWRRARPARRGHGRDSGACMACSKTLPRAPFSASAVSPGLRMESSRRTAAASSSIDYQGGHHPLDQQAGRVVEQPAREVELDPLGRHSRQGDEQVDRQQHLGLLRRPAERPVRSPGGHPAAGRVLPGRGPLSVVVCSARMPPVGSLLTDLHRAAGVGRGFARRNTPLPEPHLVGLGAGILLNVITSWRLVWPAWSRHGLGWPLILAGLWRAVWSVRAAADVDTGRPDLLVRGGPYAFSRNPMYLAWTLIYLGIALLVHIAWLL